MQRGAFGACLMAEPALVRRLRARRCATRCALPVTVKHRIGIDRDRELRLRARLRRHGRRARGCEVFIVHARNAWLQGPVARRRTARCRRCATTSCTRLKRDFPALTIVLNGGLTTDDADRARSSQRVDGVMIGRAAYHDPWPMAEWDARFFGDADRRRRLDRDEVEAAMVDYMERRPRDHGEPWSPSPAT